MSKNRQSLVTWSQEFQADGQRLAVMYRTLEVMPILKLYRSRHTYQAVRNCTLHGERTLAKAGRVCEQRCRVCANCSLQ
jgi:hypothetical protein